MSKRRQDSESKTSAKVIDIPCPKCKRPSPHNLTESLLSECDQAHARVEIPLGVALVEHTIFCGKDAGVTIYVHPGPC